MKQEKVSPNPSHAKTRAEYNDNSSLKHPLEKQLNNMEKSSEEALLIELFNRRLHDNLEENEKSDKSGSEDNGTLAVFEKLPFDADTVRLNSNSKSVTKTDISQLAEVVEQLVKKLYVSKNNLQYNNQVFMDLNIQSLPDTQLSISQNNGILQVHFNCATVVGYEVLRQQRTQFMNLLQRKYGIDKVELSIFSEEKEIDHAGDDHHLNFLEADK